MNISEIIETIRQLSHSQGFYGRLLERILYLQEHAPVLFEQAKETLERQQFKDSVDLIFYFENL